MTRQRQKVTSSPGISLNLLGEYLVSSPIRRRSILRQAKFPSVYIRARYGPARRAASLYFSDTSRDRGRLKQNLEASLAAAEGQSTWRTGQRTLCEQALSCVLGLEEALKLDGFDVVLGDTPSHRLEIGGVEVIVAPDLVVQGPGARFGVLKFRFVKAKSITKKWADYCATLLHQFAEECLSEPDRVVDRGRCNFVDVFAGEVHAAPASFTKLRKDIEAACWEIKGLWPSVQMAD